MKISHRSYKLGAIVRESFTLAQLIELFTAEEHIYPGQRDHAKGIKKKAHVRGHLRGDSRRFAAVYVTSLKKLMGIDGYHRANALNLPDGKGGKLAWLTPDQPHVVDTFVVQTMEEAHALFAQFNSLAAAKRSQCWFDSALREAGVLRDITSKLVLSKGKAYAVQFAAGMRGSNKTKAATLAVIDGIKTVDSFRLARQDHEFVGPLAVYLAVAQHCKNTALVRYFVRSVNQVVFTPETKTDKFVETYHTYLKTNGIKTGGAASEIAFAKGLTAFANFAYAKARKRMPVSETNMTLSMFVDLMKAL